MKKKLLLSSLLIIVSAVIYIYSNPKKESGSVCPKGICKYNCINSEKVEKIACGGSVEQENCNNPRTCSATCEAKYGTAFSCDSKRN